MPSAVVVPKHEVRKPSVEVESAGVTVEKARIKAGFHKLKQRNLDGASAYTRCYKNESYRRKHSTVVEPNVAMIETLLNSEKLQQHPTYLHSVHTRSRAGLVAEASEKYKN